MLDLNLFEENLNHSLDQPPLGNQFVELLTRVRAAVEQANAHAHASIKRMTETLASIEY